MRHSPYCATVTNVLSNSLSAHLLYALSEQTTELATSNNRKSLLFLFFLSPLIGEVLSGSTPPLAFINPIVFLFLGALYGSGAILIRDYVRRWNKGWRSVLLLGAAYGIIEEGILVRSFFNPNWKDLGILSTYGRWIGVNWVWAEWLAIYHAIFSIAIPIFLVEQTWPQAKKQIWLSPRNRVMFHGLLIASIIAGFFAFPYDAPILGLVGCVVAVVTLGWLSKHLPNINKIDEHVRIRWRRLIPLGFSAPGLFFFMFNSGLIPYAIITMILGIGLVFGYERLLTNWTRRGLTQYQKLGLVSGALVFFALFFDFIIEFQGLRGASIVGILFTVFLFKVRKQVRVQNQPLNIVVGMNAEVPSPSLR